MSPVKKEYIILSVVSNEYKITIEELTKPCAKGVPSSLQEPKLVAMRLLRKNTFFAIPRIAPVLGYSSAFSMSYADNILDAKLFNDEVFRRRMAKLEAILPQIFNIHK
jgi:chromosomal replication initiation ATPase DnaA